MTIKAVITVSMILFAVIDIIGSIPVIIDIRRKVGTIHPEKVTIVSLIIMISFLFLGESILGFMGIDIPSFAIAGGLVLLFIALEMILGIKIYKDETPATASIVPIAFPLIAGAGTMTTLISLRSKYDAPTIIIGVLLNLVVVYLCLKNLGFLENLLGAAGIAIIRKVFGFILLAIAVNLFRSNLGV
ncbi:MAG: MarC family protein [Bacteroidetes bacterium]|nr:MarC family protein [Bacteroidota bacterium]MBL0051436.1 MarC family protein [Bacteroidota bacterium]